MVGIFHCHVSFPGIIHSNVTPWTFAEKKIKFTHQALVVKAYVQWLMRFNVDPSEIAVVTPYRAQAALLLGWIEFYGQFQRLQLKVAGIGHCFKRLDRIETC